MSVAQAVGKVQAQPTVSQVVGPGDSRGGASFIPAVAHDPLALRPRPGAFPGVSMIFFCGFVFLASTSLG